MRRSDAADRLVDVTAYITDERYGLRDFAGDHWRARQEIPGEPDPPADAVAPALLVVCGSARERDALRAAVAKLLEPAGDGGAAQAQEAWERRLALLKADLTEVLRRASARAVDPAVLEVLAVIVEALDGPPGPQAGAGGAIGGGAGPTAPGPAEGL